MDLFYALGFAFFVFIVGGVLLFQRYLSNSVALPESKEEFSEEAPHVSINVSASSVVNQIPVATLVQIVPAKSACTAIPNQHSKKLIIC